MLPPCRLLGSKIGRWFFKKEVGTIMHDVELSSVAVYGRSFQNLCYLPIKRMVTLHAKYKWLRYENGSGIQYTTLVGRPA